MCAQVAPSGECLRGKGPPDQMLAKPWRGLFLVAYTGHPGQLSLAIPSWVGAMSTSQWDHLYSKFWGDLSPLSSPWSTPMTVRMAYDQILYASYYMSQLLKEHGACITKSRGMRLFDESQPATDIPTPLPRLTTLPRQ